MANTENTTTTVDRRIMLSLMAGAATVGPIGAAQALTDDAELLALESEIVSLCSQADRITAERVTPHDDVFLDLIVSELSKAAREFAALTGRNEAIAETAALHQRADVAMRRMWSIPARTDAGRQAKIHVLFLNCLGDDWLAPDREADWDVEMTRALLCEFAGTTSSELLNMHVVEGVQA